MSISNTLGDRRERTIGDAALTYRECGDGPPIVFVHGVFANGDVWRDVVPLLADRYRCIVPDWPLGAHAEPMPKDWDFGPPAVAGFIAGFIAALHLRNVILVANDTGGALAQLVVTEHAERIGALVLTNCDAFENFFPPLLRALTYLARVPGFIDVLAIAMRFAPAQRLVCASVAHRRPPPEILQSYFGSFLTDRRIRHDARKLLAAVDNRYTLAAARRFAQFDRPVGIGWGEDDLFFPLRDAGRLRDAFPDARLRRFPGSRTFVPEDRPRELAEFIAEIGAAAVERQRPKLAEVAQPVD